MCIVLLALWVPLALPNNGIILISPVAAGPNVDPSSYVHDMWIRWPQKHGEGGLNRLLSLTTGRDWAISNRAFSFQESPGGYTLREGNRREVRKVQDSTRAFVVYRAADTNIDLSLLAMASAGGNEVTVINSLSEIKSGQTLLARADSWDAVKRLSQEIDGRTIVVEYPPPAGKDWSRFWKYGEGWPFGWPTSGKISGLLEARDAFRILRQPTPESFELVDGLRYGGANRWLELGESGTSARILLAFFVCVPLVVATIWLGREWSLRGKELVPVLPVGILTAWVISGWLNRPFGVSAHMVWTFMLAVIICLSLATFLSRSASADDVPLLKPMNWLLLLTCLSPGMWSSLSPTLSKGLGGEQLALIAVLGGFCIRWSKRLDGFHWLLPRMSLLWASLVALFARPEWTGGSYEICLVPVATWLVGEGISPLPVVGLVLLNPAHLIRWLGSGVVWAPNNLLLNSQDSLGINAYIWIHQLVQPHTLMIFGTIFGLAMMSPRFLGHQLTKVFRQCIDLQVGLQTVAVLAAYVPSIPAVGAALPWSAGIVCLFAVFEAIRTLD
jgi:hypothetical protein